jgi:hypothetical protein
MTNQMLGYEMLRSKHCDFDFKLVIRGVRQHETVRLIEIWCHRCVLLTHCPSLRKLITDENHYWLELECPYKFVIQFPLAIRFLYTHDFSQVENFKDVIQFIGISPKLFFTFDSLKFHKSIMHNIPIKNSSTVPSCGYTMLTEGFFDYQLICGTGSTVFLHIPAHKSVIQPFFMVDGTRASTTFSIFVDVQKHMLIPLMELVQFLYLRDYNLVNYKDDFLHLLARHVGRTTYSKMVKEFDQSNFSLDFSQLKLYEKTGSFSSKWLSKFPVNESEQIAIVDK